MQIRPLFLESEYKFWIFSSAYESMKTPERLRPSCIVPSLSLFLAKDVNWCHDVTWHYVTWESEPALVNPIENPKINLATLTFDLWLSNRFQILSRSNSLPNGCMSNGSAERVLTDRHTHMHTRDRFYTLNRWRGREKALNPDSNWIRPSHIYIMYWALNYTTSLCIYIHNIYCISK